MKFHAALKNMPQVPTQIDDNLSMSKVKFFDAHFFKLSSIALTGHVCVHPCPEHLAMALVSWGVFVIYWVGGLLATLKGGTDA
jgi:hypothetical protein